MSLYFETLTTQKKESPREHEPTLVPHHQFGCAQHVKIKEPSSVADVFIAEKISRQQIADIVGGITPVHGGGTCGIILHGPYGTGKSMLARMLPSEIDATYANADPNRTPLLMNEQTDYMWFDCEESRAQDIFRTIKSMNGFTCFNSSSLHFVVLDEADHFGAKAMKSLRGLMTASKNTVYILTTNNINSLDAGVRNRCVEVSMTHGTESQLAQLALQLTQNNASGLSNTVIQKVVKECGGSIRKLINLIQSEINRARGVQL